MYLRRKTLAKEFDCSLRTVDRVNGIIRENIGKRYPADAIIGMGSSTRVSLPVFTDAYRYRELMKRGIAPEYEGT